MMDETLDNGWKRFLAKLKELWTPPTVQGATAAMTVRPVDSPPCDSRTQPR